MVDYGLTPNGFVLKTFDQIRSDIETYQKENIDTGLDVSDDSDMGQQNVSVALEISALWELAQNIYSAFDPNVSTDWALVQLCALTGTKPNDWSKTVVTAQVTLNPDKSLPIGSIANLTNRPGTRFFSLAEVPANPAGGTFDVNFEAETPGATVVTPSLLSEIGVAVSGWTGITNASDGVTGSEPESNEDLRAKRERELVASGSTNLSAIIAAVSKVSGVTQVTGRENTKPYAVDGLLANSVYITVLGGTSTDISAAILESKAGGIRAFGSTNVPTEDTEGTEHDIGFSYGIPLDFYASVTVYPGPDWNGETTKTEIRTALSNFINGLGLGVGVNYDKAKCPILSVAGVDPEAGISEFLIGFSDPPTFETNLSVDPDEYVLSDVANIDVFEWEAPS